MKSVRYGMVLLFLLALIPHLTIAQTDCPPTRLEVGGQGQVAPGASNRIRSEASTAGQQVGQIPGGGIFDVIEGPECAGGFLWWRVNYQGTTGWTVEGNAEDYFVEPVAFSKVTATPPPTVSGDQSCVMPTRLQIGREGKTTSNTPSRLRDNPGGQQVGQINPLSTFQIVDGPRCVDGINWWQVKVSGVTGWTAEGVDGDYLIEMVELLPTATPAYIGLQGARSITWSADGLRIAVGTADGVYVFDATDFTKPPAQFLEGYKILDMAFDPHQTNHLAVVQDDGENYSANIYDVETGEVIRPLVAPRPIMSPDSLTYTAEGEQLAFNGGGTLVVIHSVTGSPVFSLMLKDFSGGEVAYMGANLITISPDGKWMGADDARALLVPVGGDNDDVVVLDSDIENSMTSAMAFSPDSQKLVVGDYTGNLRLWDVITHERTAFIRGARSTTSNRIRALAFSPDGKTVVTAEDDPTAVVRVFNTQSLQPVTAFSDGAKAKAALDLAFNPDGTQLAVIFDDTVRILDTQDYKQIAELVVKRN